MGADGLARSQDISMYGISLFLPDYPGLNAKCVSPNRPISKKLDLKTILLISFRST